MGSRDDSVARPVILFAVAGLLALALVAASGIVVVRRLAADEALSEAQQLTAISARVVERRVNDGLLTGDAESLAGWSPMSAAYGSFCEGLACRAGSTSPEFVQNHS